MTVIRAAGFRQPKSLQHFHLAALAIKAGTVSAVTFQCVQPPFSPAFTAFTISFTHADEDTSLS